MTFDEFLSYSLEEQRCLWDMNQEQIQVLKEHKEIAHKLQLLLRAENADYKADIEELREALRQ